MEWAFLVQHYSLVVSKEEIQMPRIVYPISHSFLDFPEKSSECITVYFTGCEHNCPDCHNKELQDVDCKSNTIGVSNTQHLIELLSKACIKYRTNNICLMGGDPFHPENKGIVQKLIQKSGDTFRYCVYTGCMRYEVPYIPQVVYIKCGPYNKLLAQKPEKTDEYFKLASSNQRIYDNEYTCLTSEGILYYPD